MDATNENQANPAENVPAGGAPDDQVGDDARDTTMASDGPLDKIKNKVGHFIGSDGARHGARDTDPGS